MVRGKSTSSTKVAGVRELKTHATQIMRQVREARASYVLTHRGRAVGVILPLDADDSRVPRGDDAEWRTFLDAGRRVQGRFRAGVSGVRLLSSMRR